MRVLITGGTGFVGRHVVQALQNKHSLSVPSRKDLDLIEVRRLNEGYIAHNGSIGFSDWLDDFGPFDAIVHLAATCGGIGINKDNPGRFIYENLQMGINVLEAARLAGVKKVVNLGTVCAYPKFTPVPFKEEDLWNGYPEETNAPYGIAKKTIIEMAIAYHDQYGLDVTNLLPANMAGEYDHFDEYSSHVIPAIIKKFERPECSMYLPDEPPGHMIDGMHVRLWGTGAASREFLYAGDCARAIALALERDTGPEPINLGTGREITIRDLAYLIRSIGGNDRVGVMFQTNKLDGQPRRSFDVTRAKERLGWEATTSLEEIIRRTIDWYRANGK